MYSNLPYRPDIDGLRAVAVLSVILFHAEIGVFQGGFVGVDVFFVISGYLISQRIVNDYDQGNFTLSQFYVRRVRRLFPAMASTVLGTLIAGVVLLDPQSLVSLCWSAVSTILSVANIHFFLEAGYWDSSAWTKPLLHTWSLGVEEQFYLFWPFVVLWLLTFTRRFALLALLVLTLASLAITTIVTPQQPDAAYYLTPFRVYEFGIGAICVWFDRISWAQSPWGRFGQSALLSLGLLLILYSIMFFDSKGFPGWFAVIPALGAAFVILAKNPRHLGNLLSNPVSRYLGLISYSLYLIHWPLLVFFRPDRGYRVDEALILMLGVLVLSVMQYHLVERPLRRPSFTRNNRTLPVIPTFAAAGGAAALIVTSALVIALTDGLPNRYAGEIEKFASLTKKDINIERNRNKQRLCRIEKNDTVCGRIDDQSTNVLVVGDSHTSDGLNMLLTAFPDVNYLYAGEQACPLLLISRTQDSVTEKCSAYNKRRFSDIESTLAALDFVVFSQRLHLDHVEATISTLDWFAERGAEVVVLGAGPRFKQHVVPSIIEHGSILRLNEALHSESVTGHYAADDILGSHVESLGGTYIRKRNFFCPENLCDVVLNNGQPLMFDKSHLSLDASRAFGAHISTKYRGLFDPKS